MTRHELIESQGHRTATEAYAQMEQHLKDAEEFMKTPDSQPTVNQPQQPQTNTPRTDAVAYTVTGDWADLQIIQDKDGNDVPASFARQLERELNEALDALQYLYTVCPTVDFIHWARDEFFVEYSNAIDGTKAILKKQNR